MADLKISNLHGTMADEFKIGKGSNFGFERSGDQLFLGDKEVGSRPLVDFLDAHDEIVYTVELSDNNTEYIVVGSLSTDRNIILEYSFELPIADDAITGRLYFITKGSTVELGHEYDFISPEITGVDYFRDINLDEIRLKIVTLAVGENPKFLYKKRILKKFT